MELLDRINNWREGRPAYATLPTTPSAVTEVPLVQERGNGHNCSDAPEARPRLSRCLADFTLGFADGLTVPFALTAGLSSLGKTNTVIYAGMAEICAGCISMGIGGYLAAKGEQRSNTTRDDQGLDNDSGQEDEEKSTSPTTSRQSRDIEDYIAPLQLPPDLLRNVMDHIESSPEVAARVRDHPDTIKREQMPEPIRTSPLISGFSVAIGYLLGGLLPLSPYFFVGDVTKGLLWSFGICIIALFIFGFIKEYVLQVNSVSQDLNSRATTNRRLRWDVIKNALWEGARMVVFGGIAAVAAVLCVRLFEGVVS